MRNRSGMRVFAVCMALSIWSGAGTAGEPIQAEAKWNAPPKERLDAFDRFELLPLTAARDKTNPKAMDSVQRNLEKEVGGWMAQKNDLPPRSTPARVLRVEPQLDGVRLVSGAGRFWLGPFLGSSRVLLRLRLTDAATGDLIGAPEFYQHASGMSGGFTLGVMDKAMLVRVTQLAAEYLGANYSNLAGGATGAEEAAAVARNPAQASAGAASSTPPAQGGVSGQWTYDKAPEDTARALAVSRNCTAKFEVVGNGNGCVEYVATCWSGRQLRIDCERGQCAAVP